MPSVTDERFDFLPVGVLLGEQARVLIKMMKTVKEEEGKSISRFVHRDTIRNCNVDERMENSMKRVYLDGLENRLANLTQHATMLYRDAVERETVLAECRECIEYMKKEYCVEAEERTIERNSRLQFANRGLAECKEKEADCKRRIQEMYDLIRVWFSSTDAGMPSEMTTLKELLGK
ncbi:hypothetical protein BJ508DRAFT_326195 [Ascobolus immersus RN42]|uniref:Uncharacterized protein n=1 Tax=Ascobolus immersus RN42 TaxID=1160509 RepID=A0A3N4IAN6_ASCIM|nr:hypothetical protein BJ508DRAFT_326195 [Ascobolus immersus RN42]